MTFLEFLKLELPTSYEIRDELTFNQDPNQDVIIIKYTGGQNTANGVAQLVQLEGRTNNVNQMMKILTEFAIKNHGQSFTDGLINVKQTWGLPIVLNVHLEHGNTYNGQIILNAELLKVSMDVLTVTQVKIDGESVKFNSIIETAANGLDNQQLSLSSINKTKGLGLVSAFTINIITANNVLNTKIERILNGNLNENTLFSLEIINSIGISRKVTGLRLADLTRVNQIGTLPNFTIKLIA